MTVPITPANQWFADCQAEIARLTAARDELLAVLADVLGQACQDDLGQLDSRALSAYAEGLRLLATHSVVEIEREHGRRVIARFTRLKRR
jgi:hypothetical protein